MPYYKDEKDEFWDIDKLVPKTKTRPGFFSTNEKVSEVVLDAAISVSGKEKNKTEQKINFDLFKVPETAPKKEEGLRSYTPSYSRLIKTVTIKPSIDRYDFYDTFRKAALIYFDYKCGKCDFAPFYSYKPQYSQMTPEQKKYYFFWRDEVRHKRYIKTDYSYVYLYAYEILNLPEKIGKEQGLQLLVDVWRAYRGELPRIDLSFAEWVQDYCLVYELPCPYQELKDFLFDVINAASFKEFYLSDVSNGKNGVSAMIAYLSDYDWRRGKYAGGEQAEMYKAHVENSMQRVFAELLAGSPVFDTNVKKITRAAFPGSLCTHSVKCNLEIEYFSVSESAELRISVTDALKYTENKIRACLGVKSRLAIKNLSDDLKRVIDKYFESEFERIKRERERENAPEYEQLYDAPESDVSFDDAMKIEKASWRVTARLVEGIEDYEEDVPERDNTLISKTSDNKSDISGEAGNDDIDFDCYGLNTEDLAFLKAIFESDNDKIKQICRVSGKIADAFAEKINEAFADNFGDVILEQNDDGGFVVIDDYYEEISQWLQQRTK